MVLGLRNAAVMLAVATCSAFATIQDPVEVVGTVAAEVLHEIESPSSNASGTLTTGSDDWNAYKGLPMVGTLVTKQKHLALSVAAHSSSDHRGVNSVYACFTKQTEDAAVLLNHPAREGEPAGGVAIEIVEDHAGSGKGSADGWFLAAHVYFPNDLMSGAVRLIAHRGAASASIFKYQTVNGKTVLQVVGARHVCGKSAIGGYVMLPDDAERDDRTWIAAVSVKDNSGLAVSFNAEK
eukprot:jgi/Ulvmu1/10422/UM062_0018.1